MTATLIAIALVAFYIVGAVAMATIVAQVAEQQNVSDKDTDLAVMFSAAFWPVALLGVIGYRIGAKVNARAAARSEDT